ncbi:MAG: bile acid:sodium symporter [Planctomycetes bacterium]|nr:bile acid:sodium symporter [Planctomycetota bacterium]
MVKRLFLPVGLVVAIAAALAVPMPEGVVKHLDRLRPWLVVTIFLINGYQTRLADAPRGWKFPLTFAVLAILTLGLGPLLGRGTAEVMRMPEAMALGLVVMAAVPSTLSSGIVLTEVSGGNGLWALMLTIGLNILGVFTIPFMLAWCAPGGADEGFPPLPMLIELVGLVLTPFVVGVIVKRFAGGKGLHPTMKYIPSACVILTVWISCMRNRGHLLSLDIPTLGLMAAGAMTVHLVLMAACLGAGVPLRLDGGQRRAVLFLGSQKTLPVALAVLVILGSKAEAAVIVCIVFHFLQLITDSFIASRLARGSA